MEDRREAQSAEVKDRRNKKIKARLAEAKAQVTAAQADLDADGGEDEE